MSRPIITHAYAVDRGPYGMTWKAYLQAEDLDGDMDRIAIKVYQIGYGSYPTDWIPLKPEYRFHLIGYLQWNTFSSRASSLKEGTHLFVTISIFDHSGHESNEVSLPLTFESGESYRSDSPLPPPFDQRGLPRIGHICVDLMEGTGY